MADNPLDFKDIFNFEKGLTKANKLINEFESSFTKSLSNIRKEAVKLSKTMKGLDITKKEDQKKVSELTKQVEKLTAEQLKLQKALKTAAEARKRGNKLTEEEVRKKVELQEANKKLTKQTRDQIKLSKSQAGSIQRLQLETNKLIKRRNELSVNSIKSRKEFAQLTSRISSNTEKLKANDRQIGRNQREVGNYSKALGGLKSAFLRIGAALGIVAGFQALRSVISSSISIFSSFEKANSNLEAVLGATTEQMTALSEQAKELGSVTAFTASEVTGLQTSFAKLGFPTEDIQLMTESTLNAAAAMGSGLDETAALTGATLKSFGLDASEAARVNDVLAKSTAASALDFSKLQTSMSTIAPVANAFGFSLEGTVSLLGELSNAGFDASSAATATRKILLNLADSNGKLAKSLKEPVTDLPSLVKGLKQLKSEGVDLGKALELTDVKSVAAFKTFLEGADSVLELNDALLDAGGTAEDMADTQLDNLAGSVTILNSAWEGFILSLEDGNGAFSETLRFIVDVTTELLSLLTGTEKLTEELDDSQLEVRKFAKGILSLLKNLGKLIVTFVTFRASLKAANILTKAYTATTRALRIAKVALSRGTNIATTAMKAFNKTTKANPIGLLLSLLAAAAAAFLLFRDSADKASDAQERFNEITRDIEKGLVDIKAFEEGLKGVNEFSQEQLKAQIRNGKRLLEEQERLKNEQIDIDFELFAERIKIREDAQKQLEEIEARQASRLIKRLTPRAKAKKVELEFTISNINKEIQAFKDAEKNKTTTQADENIRRITIDVNSLKAMLKNLRAFENRSTKVKSKGDEVEKKVDENSLTRLKQLEKQLKENGKLRERILNSTLDADKREFKNLTIKGLILKDEIEDLKELLKLELDRVDLEKEKQERLRVSRAIQQSEQNIQQENFELQKEFEERLLTIGERTVDEQIAILDSLFNTRRSQIEDQAEFEVENAEATIKNEEELAAKILEIQNKKNNDLLRLDTEQFDAEKALRDLEAKEREEENKKAIEERRRFVNSIVQLSLEQIERTARAREEDAEKAISLTQTRIERQRQLAERGLENSLAFEKKELAKQEKARNEAAKRAEKIAKTQALFNAYSANASNPDTTSGEALIKTLKDFAILETVAASFGDGGIVEDVLGATNKGILQGDSHKAKSGGIPVMVEGGEGFLSVDEMKNLGKSNFYAMKDKLNRGVIGTNFFSEQNQLIPVGVDMDTGEIVAELRSVKNAIESIPHESFDVGKLMNGVIDIVKVSNKKGSKKTTIHRSRI